MWKYTDDVADAISLHDCTATEVRADGADLIFTFPDGIWIAENHAQNPYGETLRTDAAQVCMKQYEVDSLYIFNELRFFRRLLCTQRAEISLATWMANINRGFWQLVFIDTYCASNRGLFQCWVCFDQSPFHKECQFAVAFERMQYFWNQIRRDRPW